MSSSPAHPQPSGQRSTERNPQVVVRAGKHYVCSGCGTWVEIPADVVGQLVIAVDPAPQPDEPSQSDRPDENAQKEGLPVDNPQVPTTPPGRPSTCASPAKQAGITQIQSEDSILAGHQRPRHTRSRRPKTPPRGNYAGQMIDGLVVPTAGKLDRALAWVTFHLTVLDRQGTEFNRLRKLLKKRRQQPVRVPRPSLLGSAVEATQQEPGRLNRHAKKRHAQADMGVAPECDITLQRNPWLACPRPSGHANRSSLRSRVGLGIRVRRSHPNAGVDMEPKPKMSLTRWHRKSAVLTNRRRLRTWRRRQGRGPP